MAVKKFGYAWNELGESECLASREAVDQMLLPFTVVGDDGQLDRKVRVDLWEPYHQVKGSFLDCWTQEIGDCVGFGNARSNFLLQSIEIYGLGQKEMLRSCHPSYVYGMSRRYGGFRISGDGSIGSWAVGAMAGENVPGGTLPWDDEAIKAGVPQYNGKLSREWGRNPGPPQPMIDMAKAQTLTYARMRSIDDCIRAITVAKVPLVICSSMGWAMQTIQQDQKSWFSGRDTWHHCMMFSAYDGSGKIPGFRRENSWGPNAHGRQLDGPQGSGWQRAEQLDEELHRRDAEVYAISNLNGFLKRKLQVKEQL